MALVCNPQHKWVCSDVNCPILGRSELMLSRTMVVCEAPRAAPAQGSCWLLQMPRTTLSMCC